MSKVALKDKHVLSQSYLHVLFVHIWDQFYSFLLLVSQPYDVRGNVEARDMEASPTSLHVVNKTPREGVRTYYLKNDVVDWKLNRFELSKISKKIKFSTLHCTLCKF